MWMKESSQKMIHKENKATERKDEEFPLKPFAVQYTREWYIFDWYLNGNWLKLSRWTRVDVDVKKIFPKIY